MTDATGTTGTSTVDAGPLKALLVVAGPDGPETHLGRTAEVHTGGCTLVLGRALRAPFAGGVLVLRRADGAEVAMLAAPRRRGDSDGKRLDVEFLPPVDPDTAWADFLGGVRPAG